MLAIPKRSLGSPTNELARVVLATCPKTKLFEKKAFQLSKYLVTFNFKRRSKVIA